MKFLCLLTIVLIGFFAMVSGQSCPRGFQPTPSDPSLCGIQRTIRGECPPSSKYDINKNLCIYVAH